MNYVCVLAILPCGLDSDNEAMQVKKPQYVKSTNHWSHTFWLLSIGTEFSYNLFRSIIHSALETVRNGFVLYVYDHMAGAHKIYRCFFMQIPTIAITEANAFCFLIIIIIMITTTTTIIIIIIIITIITVSILCFRPSINFKFKVPFSPPIPFFSAHSSMFGTFPNLTVLWQNSLKSLQSVANWDKNINNRKKDMGSLTGTNR